MLDVWFEKRFAKSCRGKASLVRYADDFVACFHQEEDAKRFVQELTKRLADFNLEVEPSKTPYRGRDAHYCTPPAQIRTGPIQAFGSHLG